MIPAERNIRENTKTLQVLKEHDNGYKIAQHDMNKRGIGEIFGIRQHGNFDVILDDLIERPDLVKKAMLIAENIDIPVHEDLSDLEDIVL